MKKSVLTLIFITALVLSISFAAAAECGFFCQIGKFFKGIFTGKVVFEPSVPTCGENHTQNIVSYWKADGDATDSVDANDGTISGATFTTGQVGQAFSFDGIDDYIQVPNADNLKLTGDATFEAWFYLNALGTGEYSIIDRRDGSSNSNYQLGFYQGKYFFNFYNGGFRSHIFDTGPTTGAWIHYAVVVDDVNDQLKLYINGELKETDAETYSLVGYDTVLTLGKAYYSGLVLNGFIDEVAIYNRALSADEIQQHYVNGKAGEQYCSVCQEAFTISDQVSCEANDGIWTSTTCTLTKDYTFCDNGITIGANNIVLDCNGYSIIGSGSGEGIYIYGRTGVTITNCIVSNFDYGIHLLASSNNMITSNTVSNNNKEGIGVWESGGIYSSNNTISGNTASNNTDGIRIHSPYNSLTGNTATGNTIYGIRIGGTGNTLTSNTASNNPVGIAVHYSSSTIVKNNTVSGNNGYDAVYVLSSTDSIFENNNIINNNLSAANPSLGAGIGLMSSAGNTIRSNTFSGNEPYAVTLYKSSSNIITNNVMSNDKNGMRLTASSINNIVSSNTISGHSIGTGIYFTSGADDNTITFNTISNNKNGIFIYGPAGNIIYNNNLIDNTGYQGYDYNAATGGALNTWYNGSCPGGNYWGACDDIDNDGFCDSPYLVDPYNADPRAEDKYPYSNQTGWDLNNNGIADCLEVPPCLDPMTITSDYNLTGNLNFCTTGITIGANNIVLDCAGYSITGSMSRLSKGIFLGRYAYPSGVTVKNCVVKNFTFGIFIENPSNSNTLMNNIVTENGNGIYITGYSNTLTGNNASKNTIGVSLSGANNTLMGNNASDNSDGGIRLNNANNNNITDNYVSGNTRWGGISIYSGSNNLISENNLSGNSWGVLFYAGADSNSVYYNDIINNANQAKDDGTNNTWDDGVCAGNYWSDWVSGTYAIPGTAGSVDNFPVELSGLIIRTEPVLVYSNMTLKNDFKICCQNGFEIKANDITLDCAGHRIIGYGSRYSAGIFLGRYAYPSGVTVKNCVVENFEKGIYLESSNGNTLMGNTVTENSNGIYLAPADSNTLTGNTANDNTIGISLYGANDNTVTGNIVFDNTDGGIRLNNANDNKIIDNNDIYNNTRWGGISIYSGSNNLISENNLSGNSWGVLFYAGADSNSVYYNDIINNANQAKDDGTNNTWDDGVCAGNYWSDWVSGTYAIPGTAGSVDNYPLENAWPNLPCPVSKRCDSNNNGIADCLECQDNDGDGIGGTPYNAVTCPDCDDTDNTVYPGATEVCNGIDDNCDGTIDEDGAALCNDNVACTDDVCNGAAGCSNTPNDANCPADVWVNISTAYWVDVPPCDRELRQDQEYIDNYCDATLDCQFSVTDTRYVVVQYEDNDEDNDGVCNDVDKCSGTLLPESVPTEALRPQHYSLIDADWIFEINTGSAASPNIVDSDITTTTTYGCSCEQILFCKPGENKGEYKFGCTAGTMNVWTNQIGWAPLCQDAEGKVAYEGEAKESLEDTDIDGTTDSLDSDNDGDGISDAEDSEPESAPVEAGKQGTGKPDWWCEKHPAKC